MNVFDIDTKTIPKVFEWIAFVFEKLTKKEATKLGNIPNSESLILIKFGLNVVFENIFDPYFFLSVMVDVEGVKTTLKVGGVKYILLNISKVIEDIVFV